MLTDDVMEVDDYEAEAPRNHALEFGGYELRPRRAGPGGPPGPGSSGVASSSVSSSPKNSAAGSAAYQASTWPRKSGRVRRGASGSRAGDSSFLFSLLPAPAKQCVFQQLSQQERGAAQRVCREWRDELRRPSYWRTVDLTAVPACLTHLATPGQPVAGCSQQCYSQYAERVRSLVQFLCRVRPSIYQLRFEFDIREPGADWKKLLEQLVAQADCSRLHYLHMNWRLTAAFPCRVLAENSNDINYRHRLRQRNFVSLLDTVLERCPRLHTLLLPFEWSTRSIEALGRMQHLHTLVLEKYHVFKTLSQETMDLFLRAVPQLQRLVLELVTPGCREMCTYRLLHEQLRYLDVSQSRGFYIDTLHAPRLLTFKLARHPWNGPLVSADELDLPCVHTVLAQGTPQLQQLNELCLPDDWRYRPSHDLEAALRAVCSCRRHKHGWSM